MLARKPPTVVQKYPLVTPFPAVTKLIQVAQGNKTTGNAKYNKTVIYTWVPSTSKLKAHLKISPPNHEFAELKQTLMVSLGEAIFHVEMCPGFSLTCPSLSIGVGAHYRQLSGLGIPPLINTLTAHRQHFSSRIISICLDGIFPCTSINRFLLRDIATKALRGLASHPFAYKIRHFY